ncbi:IMP 5'-nucleotidase [Cladochytrium tenue]|nr:IMP 5'-nucleotidase [Cladochytrium tenue]
MSHSLYSTTYHLRAHKRDGFIEFVKALLLTPFILHTRPISSRPTSSSLAAKSSSASAQPAVASTLYRSPTEAALVGPDPAAAAAAGFEVESAPDGDANVARYCEVLECIEALIMDHMAHQSSGLPELSRLTQLVPSVGTFFTPLPLRDSFLEINKKRSIAGRRNVPPSFNDIRHLLNLSQVTAIASTLELITFDGDMTLYADGADFSRDSVLVDLIVNLLRQSVTLPLQVTPEMLRDTSSDFRVFYTESGRPIYLPNCGNYLFRFDPATDRLVYIPEADYQPPWMCQWSSAAAAISTILDIGQACAEQSCEEMGILDRVRIIRKERAVGVVSHPEASLSREQLDELALAIQRRLNNYQYAKRVAGITNGAVSAVQVPFCAFNGGSDVWLDIGNKSIGVRLLQEVVGGVAEKDTLHIGDQFLSTGNDLWTRSCAATAWITSPGETADLLRQLHAEMTRTRGAKSDLAVEATA